jgi:hypothetical protein
MLRKWAHVIRAALLHIGLLIGCHHIASEAFELVRDEIAVTFYDSVRELAWAR